MAPEAAVQGGLELGKLAAELSPGQFGEHCGVPTAGHQRREHVPSRFAENVGGHARQLHPGVLEDLVQPLGLSGALFDPGLSEPGQVTQLSDFFRRDEAGPHEAVLHQPADPLGIGPVGLATRNVAHVAGVQQPALRGVFEDPEHRLPIDPGRLHPHSGHPVRNQPVPQGQQVFGERRELCQFRDTFT